MLVLLGNGQVWHHSGTLFSERVGQSSIQTHTRRTLNLQISYLFTLFTSESNRFWSKRSQRTLLIWSYVASRAVVGDHLPGLHCCDIRYLYVCQIFPRSCYWQVLSEPADSHCRHFPLGQSFSKVKVSASPFVLMQESPSLIVKNCLMLSLRFGHILAEPSGRRFASTSHESVQIIKKTLNGMQEMSTRDKQGPNGTNLPKIMNNCLMLCGRRMRYLSPKRKGNPQTAHHTTRGSTSSDRRTQGHS